MLDIFSELEILDTKLSELKEKHALNDHEMFNNLFIKQKAYMETLKPIEENISYENYNDLVSKEFKKYVNEYVVSLAKSKNQIEKEEQNVFDKKAKIVYLSNITLFDLLEILRYFNISYSFKKENDSFFINIKSNESNSFIDINTLTIVPIYNLIDNKIVINPIFKNIITSEVEEFIRYYINIKYNEKYMLINQVLQSYQKNSCIKR